jgi:3-deoxy-D-manno-octulosonic-acid transferase
MHASSVGEGLQAEAVLRQLRRDHSGWQIAYTYFSPSAEALARRQPADVADTLPWDRRIEVDTVLDALRPDVLVFCKLDLWPELATRAATRGTRVGIIAATVSRGSTRLHWPLRHFLRPGYESVTLAGAVSEEDAERLADLGVAHHKIEITGDPRFDSALDKVHAIDPEDPLLRLTRGAPTLVAGSTWPPDEECLLTAFKSVRHSHPGARLVVVPHEPTSSHLAQLDAAAARFGLDVPVRESAGTAPSTFNVVDRVGVLATVYSGALLAYVGGGFGNSGLHSVVEPAACGLPVVFGPNWQNSRDAGLLIAAGGAWEAAEGLAERWRELLAHPDRARAAGARGLETVEAGLGGAARSADLVERLMLQRTATAR